jgi:SARP family transcriptional regulator, regulator of embCAB operon
MLELIVDGAAVTPAGIRPRAVFAVLAASGGAPVRG